MPPPAARTGTRSSFTVNVGGAALDSTIDVLSIDIWSAVDRLPRARLVLADGDAAEADFPLSASDTFLPGATLRLDLGYDGTETVVFDGVVVRHGVEFGARGAPRLVVEASDKAIAMTLARKNAVFHDITDSDLIARLIGAHGLGADVAPTTIVQEQAVQHDASDWDMMLNRAGGCGMVVLAHAGAVAVKPPATDAAPALEVTFGQSMIEFQAEMDATVQLSAAALQSWAWDDDTQALAQSDTPSADVTELGDVTSETLAAVFAVSPAPQQTGAPIPKPALSAWSKATLPRNRLAKVRGRVSFEGEVAVRAGGVLGLSGVGARFNGPAYVSAVHHYVELGLWTTIAHFGLPPEPFAVRAPKVAAPAAAGLLPAVRGLQTGIVSKVAADPAGRFRVLLTLPLLQSGESGVWARLGGPYASNGFGAVFYPEVGDEVIVGFMNEDPRFPVILGGVYSKTRAPAYPPDAPNTTKAVVTRSKLEVSFDDAKIVLSIKTPAPQSIVLDDDAKSIAVKDSHGNSIVLSAAGVAIDSASSVNITAKGDIVLDAKGSVSLTGGVGVSESAPQISHAASAKFSASGAAQAKLVASGLLTLQGALVKIN